MPKKAPVVKAKMIDLKPPDDGTKKEDEMLRGTMTAEEHAKHEVFSQWIMASAESKKPIEWEWFVRKNFVDGNHWIKWNSQTNSIEKVGSGNQFKTTINKLYTTVRAVRNFITKDQPKWEVMATDLKKNVFNKAVSSEKFLDLYYLEDEKSGRSFKIKVKEAVGDAMWASCGHIWFYWDSVKKWLIGETVNPFDFFPDPTADDYIAYSDAQFVFRAYKKKVHEVQSDERFSHREDVIADGKLAASDMYVTLLKMTSGLNADSWSDQKDLETVICYEGYYKEEKKINHCVLTATATLIDEATKFDSIPARTYHTDIETNRQYTQGWVKNLIPPQKIVNTLESSTLEFNHVISKGRFVTDKGSGVNSVVNKNGQIIEKNKGAYFHQLEMQSQPQTVEQQINRADRYMEDIGSAHDAFVGRQPAGANSGVAIENLLLGEENNLADLRDNRNDFLISIGKLVLRSFAQHKMDVLTFYKNEADKNEPDFYSIVGDKSPIKMDKHKVKYNGKDRDVDIDRILENNDIQVKIGTWLGTGKVDSRKELRELFKDQIIDRQTVLEYYNAPNIPRILENVVKEIEMKAQMEAAVSQPPGTVPAIGSETDGGAAIGAGLPNGTAGNAAGPVQSVPTAAPSGLGPGGY